MTRSSIEPLSYDAVRHIILNARERDQIEARAVLGNYDPEALVEAIVAGQASRGAYGAVYGCSAVLTASYETPRSVQVALIATDDFNSIALSVTRHVKRVVEPMLRAKGITRAECRCWSEHYDARRWLSICGAREEAEIPGYGVNGETFIQMAWS